MKTGIVTVYDPLDYGNRLQNYAMHAVLSELGVDCETLVPRQNKKTQYRQRRENHIRMIYQTDPAEAQIISPEITRQIRFEEFERQYIPVRNVNTISFSSALAMEYHWLVTGGDGVWDPRRLENLGKMDNNLLSFAQSRQRVCMAPSVAAAELPPHLHDLYHDQWAKFPRLNVRSREDARLIREITGREADVLMDPLLLVDPARWQELMKPLPDFDTRQAYCLVWTGEKDAVTEETENLISQLSPDGACERYFLGSQGDAPVCTAGPSEFLYLIHNARILVTDSCCGVAFAAIFGKSFVFTGDRRIESPGINSVAGQVKAMLEQLQVPFETAGSCLWSSHVTALSAEKLPEQVRALALLRKIFCVNLPMSEGEVSQR